MRTFSFHLVSALTRSHTDTGLTAKLRKTSLLTLASLLLLVISACSTVESPASDTSPNETAPALEETTKEEATNPVTTRSAPILFGSYTYGGVWQGMKPVHELESQIGQRLDVVHWFMNWDNDFYPELVADASANGRRPLISWQPHRQSLEDIASGKYDNYIVDWAEGVRDTETTVYLRPFPEMNGYWTPWSGNPTAFIAAWQRMADIFEREGADNVRWVWSPNVTDEPATEGNRMERYFPGTEYVDVLAVSGYNWGTVKSYTAWKSFDEIFAQPYARLTALGGQPIWISEIASTEHGGDKGDWIKGMLESTAFPQMEALVWFNEDKETDWRIDSSASTLQAMQSGLASNTTLAAKD